MRKLFGNSTRLANLLFVYLLAFLPFHPFLAVFISKFIGHYTFLRLVTELVLVVLMLLACRKLIKDDKTRARLTSSLILKIILAYVVLTIVTGIYAYLTHKVQLKALGFALIINLRYPLFFGCALLLYRPAYKIDVRSLKVLTRAFYIVIGFGLLQFFVLSPKFLAHFGYDSLKNIAPVTTINQFDNMIRIQSFLRGPNPLGAYALLMGTMLFAAYLYKRLGYKALWGIGGSIAVMLLSFSRGAWLGAVFSLVILSFMYGYKRPNFKLFFRVLLASSIVLSLVAAVVLRNNSTLQTVILHTSPDSSDKQTSNSGHIAALRSGTSYVMHHPLGGGPGTAGPASLYNNSARTLNNSENYFLAIAQETGWLGLALFITINVLIAKKLWDARKVDYLAGGLLAALVALTVVCQFSYAWSDEALAYIWWGLAGFVLAKQYQDKNPTAKL